MRWSVHVCFVKQIAVRTLVFACAKLSRLMLVLCVVLRYVRLLIPHLENVGLDVGVQLWEHRRLQRRKPIDIHDICHPSLVRHLHGF